MALICGSTLPCKISKIIAGTVSFRPDTNQATANSSNDTAAVKQSAEMLSHDDIEVIVTGIHFFDVASFVQLLYKLTVGQDQVVSSRRRLGD